VSRGVRRARLGSKRARYREARDTVVRILELDDQGLSPGAIASSTGVTERHVNKTLRILESQGLEETGGGG
jgi:hypothetical protein